MHQPGDLIFHDFRHKNGSLVLETSTTTLKEPQVKVMQWNIERGYKYADIVSTCLREQADILCLQEIDINCERSGCRNVLEDLARDLGMNAVMVVEFIELDHECRSSSNAVRNSQLQNDHGLHGNAILSRWDIADAQPILHRYQPFNWPRDGHIVNEPRLGARHSLAANIETPFGFTIRCYSVHLEVFCGITGRLAQFSEIMKDSSMNSRDLPYQVIGADLNTMANGIARLAPAYCSDMLRWKTFGQTEAEFWDEYVFSFTADDGPLNSHLQSFFYENISAAIPVFNEFYQRKSIMKLVGNEDKPPLSPLNLYTELSAFSETSNPSGYQQGLDSFFINIRNNEFFECFDVNTITLTNYWGLYAGKLDWLLLRRLKLLSQHMGNDDFSASDHKYLCVSVTIDTGEEFSKPIVDEKRKTRMKKALIKKTRTRYILPALVIGIAGLAIGYFKMKRN